MMVTLPKMKVTLSFLCPSLKAQEFRPIFQDQAPQNLAKNSVKNVVPTFQLCREIVVGKVHCPLVRPTTSQEK